jgi:hypothetical protein
MDDHFNKLTPAEAELLAMLIEECSEVIKAGTKILRHGYDSYDPTDKNHRGNEYDLFMECGDVLGMMRVVIGDMNMATIIENRAQEKMNKKLYTHHQG